MEIENLIEQKDYQTLKDEIQTYIKELFNDDLTFIESDSFSLIIEAVIYREILLRARINQAIKDSFAIINRDDTNNTAGSQMAYIRAIKDVNKDIKDIKVYSPSAGVVNVVYHHITDITTQIQEYLNEEYIRPLTDLVYVKKAEVITLDFEFNIIYNKGANTSYIEKQIKDEFANYSFKIGENLSQTKALSVVHKNGVFSASTTFFDTQIEPYQIIQIGNITCNWIVYE